MLTSNPYDNFSTSKTQVILNNHPMNAMTCPFLLYKMVELYSFILYCRTS